MSLTNDDYGAIAAAAEKHIPPEPDFGLLHAEARDYRLCIGRFQADAQATFAKYGWRTEALTPQVELDLARRTLVLRGRIMELERVARNAAESMEDVGNELNSEHRERLMWNVNEIKKVLNYDV